MTPDEKATLWLKIFGITPAIAARVRCDEAPGLAGVTASPEWADVESKSLLMPGLKAKPIGLQQWKDCFALAQYLDDAVTHLPTPTPGADPAGYIWLTYRTTDGREFALELRADLTKAAYRWTMLVDGMKKTFEGTNSDMRPLIECLRATFGESASARAALETLDVDRVCL